MDKRDEELLFSLLDRDPELRKFYEEHQAFEKQLAQYLRRAHLSASEEIEKKNLQKLKLAKKDKIMEILGRYRRNEIGTEKR
jgi:uncharacterized protein YdcH (DUF465 family)